MSTEDIINSDPPICSRCGSYNFSDDHTTEECDLFCSEVLGEDVYIADLIPDISVEPAKKVITVDRTGRDNGYLIEIAKDGRLTKAYLSACAPGAFKGYHLHKVRAANYVCIQGKIKIITYVAGERKETILSADDPQRMYIPPMVPTGLSNEWEEEAWIINTPDPAYDPELKGEQVEYSQEQLDCLFPQASSLKSAWEAGF